MVNQSVKRLFNSINIKSRLLKNQESYHKFVHNILGRYQSLWSDTEEPKNDGFKDVKEVHKVSLKAKGNKYMELDSHFQHHGEDDSSRNIWKPELAWVTKALEPALQLCKRALPMGDGLASGPSMTSRSFGEIYSSIQQSKIGLEDWSLSDLTIGMYLVYLQQTSRNLSEDIKGEQISSESVVHNLIYHTELAKGAYKDSVSGLARHTMLRETNVLKFIKSSSVLRPGYYIGIDERKKLVVFGIRGTHTVYDLITDIVSTSSEEITLEGYSTHFGTAEAARWFLNHELETIRKCLNMHKGFRLRLVGHSLGGATASLLAIMLRKRTFKELGFNPDIVSAVGYATPPCVSKELAESCSNYVDTVVMQDDIIPRLSVASLTRLRNEVLQTDWITVLEKEDWKGIIGLVTNAKQVVSSVQDVARKLADFANFGGQTNYSEAAIAHEDNSSPSTSATHVLEKPADQKAADELFVPGTVYYLKRDVETKSNGKRAECFTLWKRQSGEHFQRILLSSNLISDHKCDSHYYALRDVLKGLPVTSGESIL